MQKKPDQTAHEQVEESLIAQGRESIERKDYEIDLRQRQATNLMSLRLDGAQAIIDVVGPQKFLSGLNAALELRKKRTISMYDVVAQVEPNSSKRKTLFTDIEKRINVDPRYHEVVPGFLGFVDPELHIQQVKKWESIDATDPDYRSLERIMQSIFGQEFEMTWEHLTRLQTVNAEGLTQELARYNNDLILWYLATERECEEQRNKLRETAQAWIAKVRAEIQRRTETVHAEFEPRIKQMNSDQELLRKTSMESVEGQNGIRTVLSALEKGLKDTDEETEQKIRKVTKELEDSIVRMASRFQI